MDMSGRKGEVEARQQGRLRQQPWTRVTAHCAQMARAEWAPRLYLGSANSTTGPRESHSPNTALMTPKKSGWPESAYVQPSSGKDQGKDFNAAPRPMGGRSKGGGLR